MNKLAYRRATGIAGTMLLLMALLVAVGLPAVANIQDNGNQTATCGGEWHWIHNQTNATSGTLTAVFASAGTITVTNGLSPSGNLHYYINLAAGDTLLSASDSVNDTGKLVLSHWPNCGTSTTAPTTTSSAPTTTSSAPTTTSSAPTTTTTVAPTTTTTVAPTTTTTVAPTTTTTAGGTTPSSPGPGPTTTTTLATVTTAATVAVAETEVLGIQVSAPVPAQVSPAQVATQETLPFTGVSTSSMALLAIALAGIGVLLLMASRQSEEKAPVRSWN